MPSTIGTRNLRPRPEGLTKASGQRSGSSSGVSVSKYSRGFSRLSMSMLHQGLGVMHSFLRSPVAE